MTHFNHPKELTDESRAACELLADAGFPVMNQSVLLAGVNDAAATLEALFRGLVRARVRPYYLLQADPVRGTSHFRTPLERGLELIGALQGRLTGIALPKLICDTPGGLGKVPLVPPYVVGRDDAVPGRATRTRLRTFRGEVVSYVDPPGKANQPDQPGAQNTTKNAAPDATQHARISALSLDSSAAPPRGRSG
jgi:lysine 2,3-aminomutase